MFEELNITDFNPMKDVWFPLDLSNPSSFNCIMAHAAAHISHLYSGASTGRETSSSDALMFKAEAVRILNLWLADPEKKLSDDAFAAVIRLLTFEVSDFQHNPKIYFNYPKIVVDIHTEVLGNRERMEYPP